MGRDQEICGQLNETDFQWMKMCKRKSNEKQEVASQMSNDFSNGNELI